MIVKSLNQMETIVSKNQSLSWDGWNVVELIKSSNGMLKPEGAFVNVSWYIKNVFSVQRDGWKIPNKYVS